MGGVFPAVASGLLIRAVSACARASGRCWPRQTWLRLLRGRQIFFQSSEGLLRRECATLGLAAVADRACAASWRTCVATSAAACRRCHCRLLDRNILYFTATAARLPHTGPAWAARDVRIERSTRWPTHAGGSVHVYTLPRPCHGSDGRACTSTTVTAAPKLERQLPRPGRR